MKIRTLMLAATAAALAGSTAFYAVRGYMRNTRAEMVFNEDSEPFEAILSDGLPDETADSEGIMGIVRAILGFDTREPETIIKNYSAVFDDTETDTDVEEEDKVDDGDKADEAQKSSFPTHEQLTSSTGISVNNATDYSVDPDELCSEPLDIDTDEDGPLVLIVHTHTTECFDGDNMPGETERSTDNEKNMVAVGEAMKEVLESYGIGCVHDTTIHDYPTYQGAYTRELATVEKNLEKYPSIQLVFDVHRDAFIYEDGSKLKVECDVNGVSTAKVMIVCGTDAMGLEHPYWRENFKLASKIQNAAQIMYPGMMRPINLRRERFNMHTTKGSLLFEIGSNGNTLDQAIEGGRNTAEAVAAVLLDR